MRLKNVPPKLSPLALAAMLLLAAFPGPASGDSDNPLPTTPKQNMAWLDANCHQAHNCRQNDFIGRWRKVVNDNLQTFISRNSGKCQLLQNAIRMTSDIFEAEWLAEHTNGSYDQANMNRLRPFVTQTQDTFRNALQTVHADCPSTVLEEAVGVYVPTIPAEDIQRLRKNWNGGSRNNEFLGRWNLIRDQTSTWFSKFKGSRKKSECVRLRYYGGVALELLKAEWGAYWPNTNTGNIPATVSSLQATLAEIDTATALLCGPDADIGSSSSTSSSGSSSSSSSSSSGGSSSTSSSSSSSSGTAANPPPPDDTFCADPGQTSVSGGTSNFCYQGRGRRRVLVSRQDNRLGCPIVYAGATRKVLSNGCRNVLTADAAGEQAKGTCCNLDQWNWFYNQRTGIDGPDPLKAANCANSERGGKWRRNASPPERGPTHITWDTWCKCMKAAGLKMECNAGNGTPNRGVWLPD